MTIPPITTNQGLLLKSLLINNSIGNTKFITNIDKNNVLYSVNLNTK